MTHQWFSLPSIRVGYTSVKLAGKSWEKAVCNGEMFRKVSRSEAMNQISDAEQARYKRIESQSDILVKVCQAALTHCQELRDAWERGVLNETDGGGGTRSNRNVDVCVALENALSPETCSYCGGNHWRPDCPEIAKVVLRGRAGAMSKCADKKL